MKQNKYLLGLTLIIMLLITSCSTGSAVDSHAKIIVAGSTSVQPYMELLAQEYENLNSGYAVDVQGGGSSAGITAADERAAQIGMSSRSLKGEEENLVTPTIIAKDGLAIIVHPDNPVTNLTMEQIRDIYTHKITNWSELGWVDKNIHVVTREEGSGTRGAFEELVMIYETEEVDEDGKSIKVTEYINPKSIVQNTNGSVRQLVAEDKYAIGYVSLGLVKGQRGLKPVKALAIDNIDATADNVINGTYGLFRPFLIVTKLGIEHSEETQRFIDFILSAEGQEVLVAEGLISILGTDLNENKLEGVGK